MQDHMILLTTAAAIMLQANGHLARSLQMLIRSYFNIYPRIFPGTDPYYVRFSRNSYCIIAQFGYRHTVSSVLRLPFLPREAAML